MILSVTYGPLLHAAVVTGLAGWSVEVARNGQRSVLRNVRHCYDQQLIPDEIIFFMLRELQLSKLVFCEVVNCDLLGYPCGELS